MKANFVLTIVSHKSNPNDHAYAINEKHDEEKLHQRVLVSVEESETIDERHLPLDH